MEGGAYKRAAVRRLRSAVLELGRRLGAITEEQMRLAKQYGDDAALVEDPYFKRLINEKENLGNRYVAVRRRYERLHEQVDTDD